jgi:hypothetical protein
MMAELFPLVFFTVYIMFSLRLKVGIAAKYIMSRLRFSGARTRRR